MSTTGWFLGFGDSKTVDAKQMRELMHCSYSLHQQVNAKGEAQAKVHIGGIEMTLDGLPSTDILDWGISSSSYKNGVVAFFDVDSIPKRKVFFKNGACVAMSMDYYSYGEQSNLFTRLCVQPEEITLNESATTVKENWSHKVATSSGSQTAPLADSAGAVNLLFKMENDKEEFEISRFSLAFHQRVDVKGQTTSDTAGGIVNFSIDALPSKEMEGWMGANTKVKSGSFIFLNKNNILLTIRFIKAYCILMNTRSIGTGPRTDIAISADTLQVGEAELKKRFNL